MTNDRRWEDAARVRLEKNVTDLVDRIRRTADQIQVQAQRQIKAASEEDRDLEFNTYGYVASNAIHELQTLLFNAPFTNLISAAEDAERARDARQIMACDHSCTEGSNCSAVDTSQS